jgi:hypothetical protein
MVVEENGQTTNKPQHREFLRWFDLKEIYIHPSHSEASTHTKPEAYRFTHTDPHTRMQTYSLK